MYVLNNTLTRALSVRSATRAASPSRPLRKSTGYAAIRMRILIVGMIMSVIPLPAQSQQSAPTKCSRRDEWTPHQLRSLSRVHGRLMWPNRMCCAVHHRTAPAAQTRASPPMQGEPTHRPSQNTTMPRAGSRAAHGACQQRESSTRAGLRVSATICSLSASG